MLGFGVLCWVLLPLKPVAKSIGGRGAKMLLAEYPMLFSLEVRGGPGGALLSVSKTRCFQHQTRQENEKYFL